MSDETPRGPLDVSGEGETQKDAVLPAAGPPSPLRSFENLLAVVMAVVLRGAFASLAAGLVLSLASTAALGPQLLTAGLLGLLAMPLLRVAAIIVTALRTKDGLLLAATLGVLAILVALTLRDAGRH